LMSATFHRTVRVSPDRLAQQHAGVAQAATTLTLTPAPVVGRCANVAGLALQSPGGRNGPRPRSAPRPAPGSADPVQPTQLTNAVDIRSFTPACYARRGPWTQRASLNAHDEPSRRLRVWQADLARSPDQDRRLPADQYAWTRDLGRCRCATSSTWTASAFESYGNAQVSSCAG
jgi:hypothetical protein